MRIIYVIILVVVNIMKNNEKIELIKRYYKKNPTFLDLTLINYESYNIYITLNYIKKLKSYRLSWFNLNTMEDKNVERYLSCAYISLKSIELIKEDFSKFVVESIYHEELSTEEDTVILNANIKTKVDDEIHVSFKRYLPKSLAHLFNLLCFIFGSMPRNYQGFLYEITASLTDTKERYEYKREFDFDLFKDDIDKLFGYQITQRGQKYYEDDRVKFLEKIEDRYFAVVEGNKKYLVVIKYDEENKKASVYCSCPCEFYCKHIYAVIMAIRNNKFNRFYKIFYKNPEKSLIERIMEFDYILCIGVIEQNLEIINNYGEIELVPILDINGKYNWEVLEDTIDEKLTKEIKYFLDNN